MSDQSVLTSDDHPGPHRKTRNLSVLILIDTASIGGPGKGVIQLAAELKQKGIPCLVACYQYTDKPREFIKALQDNCLDILILEQKFILDPGPFIKLLKAIKKRNIQILQTHGYKGHFFALPLKLISGARWFSLTHGWTYQDLKVRIYNYLERFLLRFSDSAATVSHDLYRELVKIRKNKEVHLILNAVEPPKNLHKNKSDLCLEFNIPKSHKIFLAAGRLSSEKGHAYLIKAWAMFQTKAPDSFLLIAGDGPELNKLKQLCQQLAMNNSVLFIGYRNDLAHILQAADYMVLPSLSEGLPNILLESMASKTVSIATSVGMVPELIRDKDTGFIVPAGDVELLSQSLLKACELSDDQLNEMKEKAFYEVVKNYGISKRVDKFLKVYKHLIESKSV